MKRHFEDLPVGIMSHLKFKATEDLTENFSIESQKKLFYREYITDISSKKGKKNVRMVFSIGDLKIVFSIENVAKYNLPHC